MIVLHEGKQSKSTRPGWELRVNHRCPRCHTVYRLEDQDYRNVIDAEDWHKEFCSSRCPICDRKVYTDMPRWWLPWNWGR